MEEMRMLDILENLRPFGGERLKPWQPPERPERQHSGLSTASCAERVTEVARPSAVE
jgi:hypothetical protein